MMANSTAARVWEFLCKGMVPLSVVIGAALIGHEVRISRIEDTRFTKENGLQLEHRIERWIENRFPPGWLLDDVREIKDDIRELKALVVVKNGNGNGNGSGR